MLLVTQCFIFVIFFEVCHGRNKERFVTSQLPKVTQGEFSVVNPENVDWQQASIAAANRGNVKWSKGNSVRYLKQTVTNFCHLISWLSNAQRFWFKERSAHLSLSLQLAFGPLPNDYKTIKTSSVSRAQITRPGLEGLSLYATTAHNHQPWHGRAKLWSASNNTEIEFFTHVPE